MPAELSTVSNRESLLNDSRRELAESFPDTTVFFDAWLDSVRASSKPIDSPAPVSPFKFEGTLRIDCQVAASLVNSLTGTLIVGKTGEVQANIVVATAIVDGLVRGDIRASERVDLGATALVFGNIETPALAVQPGAVFEGQCHFPPSISRAGREQIAPSPADNSTVFKGSLRRTLSEPDPQGKAEPLAVAAGR